MEELGERVAKRCTLAPYEVRLAMDTMEDVWYEAFERGRPIQIGTIGTLHQTIRATLQDSEQTVNQKSIKKISCCLRFVN